MLPSLDRCLCLRLRRSVFTGGQLLRGFLRRIELDWEPTCCKSYFPDQVCGRPQSSTFNYNIWLEMPRFSFLTCDFRVTSA